MNGASSSSVRAINLGPKPGSSNEVNNGNSPRISNLSGLLLVPLQMAPDTVGSSNSLVELKQSHDYLKNKLLRTSDTSINLGKQIQCLQARNVEQEELFNLINMDWDQLNEDLYFMAKFSEPFNRNNPLPLPIQMFPYSLKALNLCTTDENYNNFLELYNDTLGRMEDCTTNFTRLKSPFEKILSGTGNTDNMCFLLDTIPPILICRNESQRAFEASLIQYTVHLSSDKISQVEENLKTLRDANDEKKARVEDLEDKITNSVEQSISLEHCLAAWECRTFEGFKKKNVIKYEVKISPEDLEIRKSNAELKERSKELMLALQINYHFMLTSNSALKMKTILQKLDGESLAKETEWYSLLKKNHNNLLGDRLRTQNVLEEILNREKEANLKVWTVNLVWKMDQLKLLSEKLSSMQNTRTQIYTESKKFLNLTEDNENLLLKTEGIKIQIAIDQFEHLLLQQVDLKLCCELSHYKKYSSLLSEEQRILQKQNEELQRKIQNGDRCQNFNSGRQNGEIIGRPSSPGSIIPCTEINVNQQNSELECEDITSLKLQIQQQNSISANLNYQLSVVHPTLLSLGNEDSSNEDIQTSVEAMQKEINTIKLELHQQRTNQAPSLIKSSFNVQNSKKYLELTRMQKFLSSELIKKDEDNFILAENFNKVSNALDELRLQNPVLIKKLHEIESKNLACLNEQSSRLAYLDRSKESNRFLGNALDDLSKYIENDSYVGQQEMKINQLKEKYVQASDRKVQMKKQSDKIKFEIRELMLQLDELELKRNHLCVAVSSLQSIFLEPDACLLEEQDRQSRLELDINRLKKEIQVLDELHKTSGHKELFKELQEWKDTLKCQSCKVRNKDTLLQTCFHTFCNECMKKRLHSRQRRCPECYTLFSFNDIKPLEI